MPSRATRAISREEGAGLDLREMVEHQRGVHDVERAVRVGDRPSVADLQRQARRRRDRRVRVRRGRQHLRRGCRARPPGGSGPGRRPARAGRAGCPPRRSHVQDGQVGPVGGERLDGPLGQAPRRRASGSMRRRSRRFPARAAGSSSEPSSSSSTPVMRSIARGYTAAIAGPSPVPLGAMRPDRRRTLPLAAALAALLLSTVIPDVAAYSARFPTQSLGDRGADVRAIQGLLTANGVPTSVNGLFTPTTAAAVKAFQAREGPRGRRDRRRRDLGPVDPAPGQHEHRPRGGRAPDGAPGEAALQGRRRRGVRRDDGLGGARPPEALGPAGDGHRRRHDVAPPPLALPVRADRQGGPVRLQRRQRERELGHGLRDRLHRPRRPPQRRRGTRTGRIGRRRARARWEHRGPRHPRGRAGRRRPAHPQGPAPVPGRVELPVRRATTARPRARSSRPSGRSRPAT